MNSPDDSRLPAEGRQYAIHAGTTQWTAIQKTADADPEAAAVALDRLARQYRPALCAYVGLVTGSPQDVEDLVHGFFEKYLLRLLRAADADAGSFRGLLRVALDRWLKDVRRKSQAGLRDERLTVPLGEDGDEELLPVPDSAPQPDEAWDNAWRECLLRKAMAEIEEHGTPRERQVMRALRENAERREDSSDAEMAATLGLLPANFAQVKRRVRERMRTLIREFCADSREYAEECGILMRMINSQASGAHRP